MDINEANEVASEPELYSMQEVREAFGAMRTLLCKYEESVMRVAQEQLRAVPQPGHHAGAGLDVLFGRWPGDETDEQLAKALTSRKGPHGQGMSEDELFAAVNEYADHYSDDFNSERWCAVRQKYRDPLLVAIRKWADRDGHAMAERVAGLSGMVADLSAQLAVYDKLACGFKLLQAKAFVCDAYMAKLDAPKDDFGGTDLEPYHEKLRAAVMVVRQLLVKEPLS